MRGVEFLPVAGVVTAALIVCAALVSPAVADRLERRRSRIRPGRNVELALYGFSAGAALDVDGLEQPAPYAALADRLQLGELGAPSAPSG